MPWGNIPGPPPASAGGAFPPKHASFLGFYGRMNFKSWLGALVRNLNPQGYLRNNVRRKFFKKNNDAEFSRQTPKFLCLSIASLEILVSRLSDESRIIYFSKKFYWRFLQVPLSVLKQSHYGRRLLKFMRLKNHQKSLHGCFVGSDPGSRWCPIWCKVRRILSGMWWRGGTGPPFLHII